MTGVLSVDQFGRLFADFRSSARRLENRARYDVPAYRDALRSFANGDVDGPPPRFLAWEDTVRTVVAAGRRVSRTRVIDRPLNDYQLFALNLCRHNVEAGEDVRYLDRAVANTLDLPDHDFWVFDDQLVVLLRYTADDRPLESEAVTDPEVVARHGRWIDLASSHAVSYPEFRSDG